MLSADISHRVARAMQAPAHIDGDSRTRFDVMRDTIKSSAMTFSELPVSVQEFVLEAEQEIAALTAAGDFDEAKHKRDGKGRFAKKAGGPGGKSKKLKITHMLIHKGHGEPGSILAENGAGDKRVVWDGKEYRLQRKTDDNKWTTEKKVKKSKAYVEVSAFDDDWREPSAEQSSNTTPTNEVKPNAEPAVPKTGFIPPAKSMDDLTKISSHKKGGIFKDQDGKEWNVQPALSESHAYNHFLAANLYAFTGAGVEVADLVEIDSAKIPSNSKLGVKTSHIPGVQGVVQAMNSSATTKKMVNENFAVDAWLGNWDVVGLGYENLAVDDKGTVRRTNIGGSLLYRANGQPKGNAFGSEVTELDTLRDPHVNPASAKVFADVTEDDIRAGVAKIEKLSPKVIDYVVDHSGFTGDEAEKLKSTLKARRQYLIDKYGSGAQQSAKPDTSVAPQPAPSSLPTATNALGGTKTYTQLQKAKVQAIFSKHNLKWHNKTDQIYDAAHEVSTTHPDLTMSDALDIMDQSLKKKTGNPFRTKVEKWLKTKAGKQHALTKGGSASLGSTTPKTTPTPSTPTSAPSNVSSNGFAVLSKSQADTLQASMDAQSPPPWTVAQRDSLRTYTGGSYIDINKCARGTAKCTSETKAHLENIMAAMKPSTQNILVHRATNPKAFGLETGDDLKNLIGKSIKDDGVISTSIKKIGWSGKLRLDIEVPKGSKIAWVQPISLHPSEMEMVVAPGTHYEIVGYEKVTNSYGEAYYNVRLRIIPGSDTLSRKNAELETAQ